VRASHSGETHGGRQIGRVSGITSGFRVRTREDYYARRSEPFLVTSRNNVFWILLFQLILAVSVAWGQDASKGALRGVVLDAHAAAITTADIVAIPVDTGIRYHSATDSAGRFAVDLLPPGEYSARAEAEGMLPQISPVLRVEIGVATQLTFKLKVAGPKETTTAADAPRMVEMNPSSVSALLDERVLKDLPLNGRRFTDLLLLVPGVTQDPLGLTRGSNGDLSYGGIRGYNTSFLVDGGDDNKPRVSSSGYGAESGARW
jgi:carboxypeptidase family protein